MRVPLSDGSSKEYESKGAYDARRHPSRCSELPRGYGAASREKSLQSQTCRSVQLGDFSLLSNLIHSVLPCFFSLSFSFSVLCRSPEFSCFFLSYPLYLQYHATLFDPCGLACGFRVPVPVCDEYFIAPSSPAAILFSSSSYSTLRSLA